MPNVPTPTTRDSSRHPTSITKRIVVTIFVDVDDVAPAGGTESDRTATSADSLPAYPVEPARLTPRQAIRRLRNPTRNMGLRSRANTGRSDEAVKRRRRGRRALALAGTTVAILMLVVSLTSSHGSVPSSGSPTVTAGVNRSVPDSDYDQPVRTVEEDQPSIAALAARQIPSCLTLTHETALAAAWSARLQSASGLATCSADAA
jgi:hypothetical protein